MVPTEDPLFEVNAKSVEVRVDNTYVTFHSPRTIQKSGRGGWEVLSGAELQRCYYSIPSKKAQEGAEKVDTDAPQNFASSSYVQDLRYLSHPKAT